MEDFFRVYTYPHLNTSGLGEIKTVKTQKAVKGLHNSWEFFQPTECLDEAMQTWKELFYCFDEIFLVTIVISYSHLNTHIYQ